MNPFSRNTIIIILAVIAVSLATTIGLTVLGGDVTDEQGAGVDGYSVSAIGHRGLAEMLGKLDIPVIVSRSDSAAKAKAGLLIIAEPTVTDDASRERLETIIAESTRTLVVLPKWYGQTERGKRWIDDADFIPIDEIDPMFAAMGISASVTRFPAPVMWTGDTFGTPSIREPQLVTTTSLTPVVSGPDDTILVGVAADESDEALEGSDRALFGEMGNRLWVLSDPDVLNNHGLRIGDNARFTIQLIDNLRHGGPVVIDETLHGYAQQPSLLRTLFRFPLILATLQVLVCAILVVWAAMVRFGPKKATPPPYAPGKDFLVRNTAALLAYGGHHSHGLRRYLALSVGAVRRALHAPALPSVAMTKWLEQVRERRGCKISLLEIEKNVETADTPQRVVEVADQVFRWRMEMTSGTDNRS